MRKKIFGCIGRMLVCLLVSINFFLPHFWEISAGGVTLNETDAPVSVEVATLKELLQALSTAKENEAMIITVTDSVTLSNGAATDGRMLPVEIPKGVTLRGANSEVELYCRCPLQLTGDDVTIKDITLQFESTDALGSVVHREIFLAGHSLVMDNVDTYLQGGGDSLGGFGGTEEELLPSIYAGGFEGTEVAEHASVTIKNANEHTMFENIVMGHETEEDAKEPYTGKATLVIGPKTIVRGGIYVNLNSAAEITVTGAENMNLNSAAFYGNENTKMRLEKIQVNRAAVENVGTVELDQGAYLQLISGNLKDIVLKNGASLDLVQMNNVTISGNLTGGSVETQQTDTTGILVLSENGMLQVEGNVTGSTVLHTENHIFPGDYVDAKTYVTVKGTSSENGFVLPKDKKDYFEMEYADGLWTIYALYSYEMPLVGSVEIISAPKQICPASIAGEAWIPVENAPYCTVIWKDENGDAYSAEEVVENQFYANDIIIAMRKDYWESSAYDNVEAWSVPVCLVRRDDTSNNYYFYMENGKDAEPGNYVYLFCSEYFDSLGNVADVKKQLAGKVLATLEVTFVWETVSENNSGEGTAEEIQPDPPHVHDKIITQRKQAAVGRDGYVKQVCEECGQVLSTKEIPAPKTVQLSKKHYTYSGKLCKPKVVVRDRTGNVIDSSQFTVTYVKNKNVGKAEAVISMCGDYTGSFRASFTISPKKTKISKIVSKKERFTVKWKKVTAQISGYQIQYSTGKKFAKKTTKTVYVKKAEINKKTIKKPKAGRKYYVRIRTYKTVKVAGKKIRLYSAWSKVKKTG